MRAENMQHIEVTVQAPASRETLNYSVQKKLVELSTEQKVSFIVKHTAQSETKTKTRKDCSRIVFLRKTLYFASNSCLRNRRNHGSTCRVRRSDLYIVNNFY